MQGVRFQAGGLHSSGCCQISELENKYIIGAGERRCQRRGGERIARDPLRRATLRRTGLSPFFAGFPARPADILHQRGRGGGGRGSEREKERQTGRQRQRDRETKRKRDRERASPLPFSVSEGISSPYLRQVAVPRTTRSSPHPRRIRAPRNQPPCRSAPLKPRSFRCRRGDSAESAAETRQPGRRRIRARRNQPPCVYVPLGADGDTVQPGALAESSVLGRAPVHGVE